MMSDIPHVVDGLTRKERAVLVTLAELEHERGQGPVPLPLLYGRVVERCDMSVAELQAIVARLAGKGVPPQPVTPDQIGVVASPLGELVVHTSAAGELTRLDFAADGHGVTAPVSRPIQAALASYFAGDLTAIDGLPVAGRGTAFQREVWRFLRTIPAGETRTYGELALAVGKPVGASRAVGAANGQNPIALVVPCHRVIAQGGKLGGYSGGLERKRWLLAHEQRHAGFRLRS
jgi:methylated-DNA-[protein]-cysteine S-methyltransferase